MALFKQIGHVAFNVRDMDAALSFYRDTLGFDEMFRLHNDEGDLSIIYLRITDSQFLELFPAKGEIPTDDRNFSHLCLEVDNLDATVAELQKRGVEIVSARTQGKAGSWQAWIADTEGNRIELMEIAPNSLHRTSVARLAASA
jgi:lactoylglutathione lyase